MSKEAFYDAVYKAYREGLRDTSVRSHTSNGRKPDLAILEQRVRQSNSWLTPAMVEQFDPADFTDLPQETQTRITSAVEQFRHIVSSLTPATTTPEQRDQAWSHFQQLLYFAREQELKEWLNAIDDLYRQCEDWALRHEEWTTRRYTKTLKDDYLGEYETQQLLIHRLDGRFILDPISRYTAGDATGVLELYLWPSMDRRILRRFNGTWAFLPERRGEDLRPLSEEGLNETLDDLFRVTNSWVGSAI